MYLYSVRIVISSTTVKDDFFEKFNEIVLETDKFRIRETGLPLFPTNCLRVFRWKILTWSIFLAKNLKLEKKTTAGRNR